MTTIITITAEEIYTMNTFYDYSGEDRILRNILSGDYEVLYSGQNQGGLDHQLIHAVNSSFTFRVYYRRNKKSCFIFLGATNYATIVKERTIVTGINSLPNERLQIRLVIPLAEINKIRIETEFEGSGKYKKAVLQHSGFDTRRVNINVGFYTRM